MPSLVGACCNRPTTPPTNLVAVTLLLTVTGFSQLCSSLFTTNQSLNRLQVQDLSSRLTVPLLCDFMAGPLLQVYTHLQIGGTHWRHTCTDCSVDSKELAKDDARVPSSIGQHTCKNLPCKLLSARAVFEQQSRGHWQQQDDAHCNQAKPTTAAWPVQLLSHLCIAHSR